MEIIAVLGESQVFYLLLFLLAGLGSADSDVVEAYCRYYLAAFLDLCLIRSVLCCDRHPRTQRVVPH